jgi:putative ABC transport system permease protein
MNSLTLIRRSIRFHIRAHLGLLTGVAVATGVIVGALIAGDSVRYSLVNTALSRLGRTELALASNDRFFRAKLADDIGTSMNSDVAPILNLRGIVSTGEGTARANNVNVIGIDQRFWSMGQTSAFDMGEDEAVINTALATKLGLKQGDQFVLRVDKPSLLPADMPLASDRNDALGMRLRVKAAASDERFGRFSLSANQVAPLNVFVPLHWLAGKMELADKANVMLVGADKSQAAVSPQLPGGGKETRLGETPRPTKFAGIHQGRANRPGEPPLVADANAAVVQSWQLEDAQLSLSETPVGGLALSSERVFIDPVVANAALETAPEAKPILTYFVNEIKAGGKSTPYSFVAAPGEPLISTDLARDEVVINEWLADDLGIHAGDKIEMTYYLAMGQRRLEEKTAAFKVKAVIPIAGPAADRTLTPTFPGLSEVENCRDWDQGIAVDMSKMRQKDEDYWKQYRGTPKAFVTLEAAQGMWSNRFGNLTSIRFPAGTDKAKIEKDVLGRLEPASLGLNFQAVREDAISAAETGTDFGQLFVGLTMFIVIAALLLVGLLFVFSVEQRAEETGLLSAVGFPPAQVRRILLIEAGMVAVVGGLIGILLGIFYGQAVVYGLNAVWKGAVGGAALRFHARWETLFGGFVGGALMAVGTLWTVTRRQAGRPVTEMLKGGGETNLLSRRSKPWISLSVMALCAVGAVLILKLGGSGKSDDVAGAFFGSGALLLLGGLAFCNLLLLRMNQTRDVNALGILGLSLRNCVRRRGRSLAVIALLACGIFIVVAVGANRKDVLKDAERKESGTGGFAWIAETTVPIVHDLNNPAERKRLGLTGDEFAAASFVNVRIHEGDEASCLNLNRVQRPRILGVKPEGFAQRGAFSFAKTLELSLSATEGGAASPKTPACPHAQRAGAGRLVNALGTTRSTNNPWCLLNEQLGDDLVPAIADETVITWGLGKKLGDTLDYTDENGHKLKLKLVGALANSIFQGNVLISEQAFLQHFPSAEGYRLLLIDCPSGQRPKVAASLMRSLQDYGLDLTPAAARLAEFNVVENTYLSIFMFLGGLGLILGSVGMGVVVLRNVLERRSELALLRAVGFSLESLRRMVVCEHVLLLLAGLVCGTIAAAIAVIPALKSGTANVSVIMLAAILLGVTLSGLLWTWLATILATRGNLIPALRNE